MEIHKLHFQIDSIKYFTLLTDDVCEGHDVVLGEGERLDLGEFAGLADVRDDFSQILHTTLSN